ncbi:MAG: LysR family transcriptional regulator [Clostridiaceae bacterium]|nr:LysR family transcriptional regulator [Clostridiaceae bacterium]
MNLTYYRNFIEIVECGTISAAARKLLLAQPALSAQLKAMERELGAELLERTARQAIPTDAGRILYEKAKSMLMLQDVVEKEIAACVRGSRGTLWLGMSPALPDALLTTLLTDFHQRHPEVVFELFENNSDQVVELIKSGIAEIGLIRTSGVPNPILETVLTVEEHLTAVYRRGNPWLSSAIREVPLRMLRDVPLSVSRGFRKVLEDACTELRFTPNLLSVGTSRAATLLWAEQNAAVAIVVDSDMEPHQNGDLCFRPLRGNQMQTNRALVVLKNRRLSAVAQIFINYCSSHTFLR